MNLLSCEPVSYACILYHDLYVNQCIMPLYVNSTRMSTGPVGRVMTPPGSMAMMPAGMMPAGKPAAAQASTGPWQTTAVSISGHTVQSQYFLWGPPVSVNHLSHQPPFQDVRLQMQDGSLAGPGHVDDIASPRRCKHFRAFIPFLGWSPCPWELLCKDPVGALLCWGFAYLLASPLLVDVLGSLRRLF